MPTFQQEILGVSAVAAIKLHTDLEPTLCSNFYDIKQIIGPGFKGGEFCTAKVDLLQNSQVFRTDFFLYERSSWVIFTFAHENRADAIAEGRLLLLSVLPEDLENLIVSGRRRVASIETQHAITVAKRLPKPRKIGKRMKGIFEAAEGKCHYCKTILTLDGKWHIEHKMPKALGGGDESINLVAACVPCNVAKRDRTDLEFIAMRASTGVSA